jgi:hypothetical protein
MPGEIPVIARRQAAWLPCRMMLLVFLVVLQDSAHAGRLLVSIDIAQGKWKTVHLKNMPKDSSVAIRIDSSGAIRVAFVHADELKRFPEAATPEFQGRVDRKLSFGVTIPRAGDYFLILDNRRGENSRRVNLIITAQKAKAPEMRPARPGAGKPGETRI